MSEPMTISGRRSSRPGKAIFAALVAICLMMWPAWLNGGAFFFPDSTAYLRSADALMIDVFGTRSPWSDRISRYQPPATPQVVGQHPLPGADSRLQGPGPLHPVLLGRSIYYGIAIFPFVIALGSSGGALFQAAMAVLAIWIVLAAFGCDRARMPFTLVATASLLSGLSSLPFFATLLMPDIFAGIAIALVVAAVTGWNRLRTAERIALAVLLIFSAMAHSSHILLLSGLGLSAGALAWLARVRVSPALILITGAVICGFAGEQLFIQAVSQRLGAPPVRPPFLTARLIDDGPGYAMLLKRCPTVRLIACRYVARMPRDSDAFLWSPHPDDGVFSVESIAVQRQLGLEDSRFVLETLKFDPLGVARDSLRMVGRQLHLTDLNLWNRPPEMSVAEMGLPEAYSAEVGKSRYGRRAMPVFWPRWLNLATLLVAAGFLWLVAGGRTRERADKRLRVAAGLTLAALLLNATITGALSKPHDRYNVRATWAAQLVALGIMAARTRRRPVEYAK